MQIRAEQPGDERAIFEVVAAAFPSPDEARLVDALRASPEFIPELSLVATEDDRIVGHVMISYALLVDGTTERRIASLAPLAVAPDVQKTGIGGALVRESLAIAEAREEPLVVLQGAPAYYSRFGFEPASAHGIEMDLPEWAPPEAAQVCRLTRHDATMRGRVVYPSAFDVVEH